MFSNESFKYLKSLASSQQKNRKRPAQFEDEFIMYTQTLVQGLNYNSNQAYFLEHALPNREDDNSMVGLILQKRESINQSFIQIKTTSNGKFQLEVHVAVEDFFHQSFGEGEEFGSMFSKSPVFDRYFSLNQDNSAGNYKVIRYEMPLRQLRSRNLIEYSIFVLNLAQPFIEQIKSVQEEMQSKAA
jgi:hypothetical protein